MADIAVSLALVLVEKLSSFIYQEINLNTDVTSNIKRLLTTFQDYLNDHDHQATEANHNQQYQNLVRQIRDYAYEIEDIIDEFNFNVPPNIRRHSVTQRAYVVHHYWSRRAALHDLSSRFQNLEKKMGNLSTTLNTFVHPNNGEVASSSSTATTTMSSASLSGWTDHHHQEVAASSGLEKKMENFREEEDGEAAGSSGLEKKMENFREEEVGEAAGSSGLEKKMENFREEEDGELAASSGLEKKIENFQEEEDGELAASSSKATTTMWYAPVKGEASGHEYEVFLSFRGKDTRRGFTDHLYHRMTDAGISVFKDNVNLPAGKETAHSLSEGIKKSKIGMPILSKHYAASRWCLDELVCMLECRNTVKQTVVPIFYNVTPSQVRHQTRSYAKAFKKHVNKYVNKSEEEKVDKWRKALAEVTSLKGLELEHETGGLEGEFTKLIVAKVLSELKKAHLVVTDSLIGINHHAEAVGELLQMDKKDVKKIVGIWGMGGIGKTTLAKFIYNQILDKFDCYEFECCSFLKDIRETSLQHKGLEGLQDQLVFDLSKVARPKFTSTDEGVKELEHRFRKKKVLVLLDDVDQINQLNALAAKVDWFGPGSRIIITTRTREVLDVHQECEVYEVDEMDQESAHQLFCKHAFSQDGPLPEFESLSHDIVKTTGGLPLALEVVGSLLSRRRKSIWEEILEKLRRMPAKEVQQRLRISYERLDDDQKQMFLDVACLYIGEYIDVVIPSWKNRKFSAENGKDVLLAMSLIKIGKDNKIWMHDQLRDLGREIDRQERDKEPGKRSRLWQGDEAREKQVVNSVVNESSVVEEESQEICEIDEVWSTHVSGWSHHYHQEELVGFQSLRDRISSQLLSGDSSRVTLSVVGPPGSGKTALVKSIYHDPSVLGMFQCRAWVRASPSLQRMKTLSSIISQILHGNVVGVDLSRHFLQRHLQDKKYLIVIDEVWSQTDWEYIAEALPHGLRGSRIIVASCINDVASSCVEYADHVHQLKGLNLEDAQNLFCKKVFADTNGDCPPELEVFAENIVKKCDGLPLAITTVAALASKKPQIPNEWKKFYNGLGSDISIVHCILPSYENLRNRSELKSCFLYFGVFPEEYSVQRGRLFRLWIAEGFVKKRRNRSLEEVAEDILNELVQRNLVHVSKTDVDGRVRSCRVLNLVREFIISVSEKEKFLRVIGDTWQKSDKVRRLSLVADDAKFFESEDGEKLNHIRSAFAFGKNSSYNLSLFKLLKVLDMQGSALDRFPEEILMLSLLRYLSLQKTNIRSISDDIDKLLRLETLDLKRTLITCLPKSIFKLRKLRYLLVYHYPYYVTFDGVKGAELIGDSIDDLTSLEKLSLIKVNKHIAKGLGFLINLRKLGVIGLKEKHGKILCESLQKMAWLSTLDVQSEREDTLLDLDNIPNRGPPFVFLRKLHLKGRLPKVPQWIPKLESLIKISLKWSRMTDDPLDALRKLPNLMELVMVDAYTGETLEFKENTFKKLKILHVEQFSKLKTMLVLGGTMPDLEKLTICTCRDMKILPIGIELLSCLKELLVYDMPNEFTGVARSFDLQNNSH